MVIDDHNTSFGRTNRLRLHQGDRSRAERYAVAISIARFVRVAGGNAHAIRLTTLGPKRGHGALEGLPGRRRLQ